MLTMIRGESLVGLIIISSFVIYLMVSYSGIFHHVILYKQKLRIEYVLTVQYNCLYCIDLNGNSIMCKFKINI